MALLLLSFLLMKREMVWFVIRSQKIILLFYEKSYFQIDINQERLLDKSLQSWSILETVYLFYGFP